MFQKKRLVMVISVITLANNKTKTEVEYSKPQQNACIQKLQMQWKSSEHGLTSSEFTVTQSVVKSHFIQLLNQYCTIPFISKPRAFSNNVYFKFWFLVHLRFIWHLDFTLVTQMLKNGCPMGDLLQKLISNPTL